VLNIAAGGGKMGKKIFCPDHQNRHLAERQKIA